MMAPGVSVVIPVWNVARLLPRCLDSLLAQTYRPLEVIVVDDGSTDGSGEVMLGYHQRHPEVHVVTQRHRGVGPARNAGLSIAHGEYVFFVDADDWVEPDFVSDLVAIAEDTGADVVVSGLWFCVGRLRAPFPFWPLTPVISGEEAARRSLSPARLPAFVWDKLYRRSLFADEPPFPSVLYEDLATTPRLLARARTVALTHRAYYHYCLRRDSITGEFGVKNVFSVIAALDILRHELHASGRWEQWHREYSGMLHQLEALVGVQVLFQPSSIPLAVRPALLRRLSRRLGELAERPTGGHELRPMALRDSGARATSGREPVSSTMAVRRARRTTRVEDGPDERN
jgi:glycosyltransferase involved in cell wall biosynthesis